MEGWGQDQALVISILTRGLQLCLTTGTTLIYCLIPLLDSVWWSISEPTSTACVYMDSLGCTIPENGSDMDANENDSFFDARDDGRHSEALTSISEDEVIPMKESEKREILEHIHSFYQENLSPDEIEVVIHTDSKHADCLRHLYASNEALDLGYVSVKRSEVLGSQRSFEALK